jgi:hypothetical protein
MMTQFQSSALDAIVDNVASLAEFSCCIDIGNRELVAAARSAKALREAIKIDQKNRKKEIMHFKDDMMYAAEIVATECASLKDAVDGDKEAADRVYEALNAMDYFLNMLFEAGAPFPKE